MKERAKVVGIIIGCISGIFAITLMTIVANEIINIFHKNHNLLLRLIVFIPIYFIVFKLIDIARNALIYKYEKKIEVASTIFTKNQLIWIEILFIIITVVYALIYMFFSQNDLKTIINFLWGTLLIPITKYIKDVPTLQIYIRNKNFDESSFNINDEINIWGKNDGNAEILVKFWGFCVKEEYTKLQDSFDNPKKHQEGQENLKKKKSEIFFLPQKIKSKKYTIFPKLEIVSSNEIVSFFYNIQLKELIWGLKYKDNNFSNDEVELGAVFEDIEGNTYMKTFKVKGIGKEMELKN